MKNIFSAMINETSHFSTVDYTDDETHGQCLAYLYFCVDQGTSGSSPANNTDIYPGVAYTNSRR